MMGKPHVSYLGRPESVPFNHQSVGQSQRSQTSSSQNKVIFQMEIKVGKLVDKIIVRKNDIVTTVIQEFVDKHKLSEKK